MMSARKAAICIILACGCMFFAFGQSTSEMRMQGAVHEQHLGTLDENVRELRANVQACQEQIAMMRGAVMGFGALLGFLQVITLVKTRGQ